MQASEGEHDTDEDRYGIICTQDYIVVDYKRIGNRTIHLFKKDHQMIQDSWLWLGDCSTIDIICNP